MSTLHHILEAQTQRDLNTDRMNAQKARDIRGLLDRQDAYMPSVNEVRRFLYARRPLPISLHLRGSLLNGLNPRVPFPSYRAAPVRVRPPKTRSAVGPTPCTIITPHIGASHHWGCRGFRSLNCGSLGSTDESDGPFLPSDRTPSTTGAHNTGGDTASESALLHHITELQEELAAQLAQMAGQLRRNAEHVSGALEADQGVLRAAEEKVSANLDMMKRERIRRDHHGTALGTTCLTISSIVVVCDCVFGHVLYHSVHLRGDGSGRWRRDKPVSCSGY
ncbi:hypothetical protein EDB85DRAFT_2291100 [Lactarius pseudohatsudake]|nr:hypothetical protein EDB85DRAFT_2295151 [Lactarius pseudohatsudake]KAH9028907.1 hypothetical protein EDB85DRAFT_2291100 [Lactarius pseudohatsudake]